MSYRIVSYYTEDTAYKDIMINYLMPSLVTHKIPNFLFVLKDKGTWKQNMLLQPSIIGLAMKTFPNDNIVWMDADTIIRKDPILFTKIPQRCDIGLYYMTYEDHYGEITKGVPSPMPEVSTSVIYFKNCPKTLALVEKWMKLCENEATNKRVTLSNIVNDTLSDDLSFFVLPREYAYLVEREDGSLPAVPLIDPIVVHFEASKYTKNNLYDAKPFLGGSNAS